MYAPDPSKTTKVNADWYKDCTLLFTLKEMKDFMASCLTRKGHPDKMFGFGFDDEKKIVQTRGDKDRHFKEFTNYLLANRIASLKEKLSA